MHGVRDAGFSRRRERPVWRERECSGRGRGDAPCAARGTDGTRVGPCAEGRGAEGLQGGYR